jgi:Uma2 family endonuclease
MPSALIEVPVEKAASPKRKRWTRAECDSLDALGLLNEQHLELVEGELIDKMGKNRPHVNALVLIQGWLIQVFGIRLVNPEAPIDVSPEDSPSSAPEPDLIVLKRDISYFRSANPGPQDLYLVVEIADTTLYFDLATKAALYARAGIEDYWVLDVSGRRLIVHRQPQAGKYTSVLIYNEQESVAPLAAPQAMFKVADAFPE